MKSILQTILMTVFATGFALAQQGQDFIIAPSGEKVFGEVRRSFPIYRKIDFKQIGNTQFQTYTAEEIRGYGMGGDFYITRKLALKEGGFEHSFLLQLVSGAASLYLQYEEVYYIEKEGAMHLLVRKDKHIDGKVLEDRRYAGLLKALFQDCGQWDKQLESLRFKEADLVDIVWAYNECKDPLLVRDMRSVEPKKLKVSRRIAAGVSYSSPNIDGDELLVASGYSPGYCIAFEWAFLPTKLSRASFLTGLHFTDKQGSVTGLFYYQYYHAQFIQPNFRASYALPFKSIVPELTAGVIYSVEVNSEGSLDGIFRSKNDFGFIGGVNFSLRVFKKLQPHLMYQFEKDHFKSHKILLGVAF